MKINHKVEYILNRKWIVDDDDEVIGEVNFIVPGEWLENLFNKVFANEYSSLGNFLKVYTPEIDGEFIYQKAVEDGVLIEDLGVTDPKTDKGYLKIDLKWK